MEYFAPKIIGSGLVANAFSDARFREEVVIFASGVSNSREVSHKEFRREEYLLKKVISENIDKEIVYFSTTSVLFKNYNEYTTHKKRMEDVLFSTAKRLYIFRLPQVVGVVSNNTLVSYLVRECLNNNYVDIQEFAIRNIVDVDDVVRIVSLLVEKRAGINTAQTLASCSNVRVPDLANKICELLGLSCNFNFVKMGDDQTVSVDFLIDNLNITDPILKPDYWKVVLNKYIPILKNKV